MVANQKQKVASIAIRLLWFAFGVAIGALLVLQFQRSREPEITSAANVSLETNPNELISINSEPDVTSRRQELISFIWGTKALPEGLPEKLDQDVKDERYAGLSNLKQINRLTISMEWGLISTAYHLIPAQANNKLIIYHRGHEGDVNGIEVIRFFLERGFSVIALSMPLEPPNNQPIANLKRIGNLRLTFHEQLKLLEMKSGHPVQLFLTPVAVSLNYARQFGYNSIFMTGVSGGGWTTTLYAAVDPRIIRSYPVAGSLPVHLRMDQKRSNTAQRSADWGDYEQTIPELYRIANYLDLYILGSYGQHRKQLQILNKYDPCCFGGDAFKYYEDAVKSRVQNLAQGNFAVYLDQSNKLHDVSDQALKIMLDDMNSDDVQSQK